MDESTSWKSCENALQISRLFGLAYGKAAAVSNAVNGFKATGICPFNPLIFPDHVHSPSDVTDIPLLSSVEQAGIAAKDVDSANDELIEPVGLVLPATTLHLGSDHEIGSSSASTNPLSHLQSKMLLLLKLHQFSHLSYPQT